MTKKAAKQKKPPVNPYKTTEALSAMIRNNDEKAIAYLVKLLKFCGGKVTKLAETLGCAPRTIYYWRDNNETLQKLFEEHALGMEGAGRALNAASVRAREAKAS